jgi:hypothetical protein
MPDMVERLGSLLSMNDADTAMDDSGAPYDDVAEAHFRERLGWRSARSEGRSDLYFDQWTWTETERPPWRSPTLVQCVGDGRYQVVWADVPFEPSAEPHTFHNWSDLMRAIGLIEKWEGLAGDAPPQLSH